MAFATLSSTISSPFQQMQREYMEGLYGMGLTGEMDINEIRRRQRDAEIKSRQMGRMFGGPSMFSPQTQTMAYQDGRYSGSTSTPSMPYSTTMMGQPSMSSFGGSSTGTPYSSTMNWSSVGAAPQFPYSGPFIRNQRDIALRRY